MIHFKPGNVSDSDSSSTVTLLSVTVIPYLKHFFHHDNYVFFQDKNVPKPFLDPDAGRFPGPPIGRRRGRVPISVPTTPFPSTPTILACILTLLAPLIAF